MTGAAPGRATARNLLLLAGACTPVYAALALLGDLRQVLPLYLLAHALSWLAMFGAWRLARRLGAPGARRWILGGALVFRLVAAWGEPALSDDVYRFVWDGRVQLHGFHPYAHAPSDPELAALRDDGWSRINHPELKTIYPPLAQALFALLALCGAGPVGFKLAAAAADFAVVLALERLLTALDGPWDRVVLYAWNPLAVMETAGSGHVEPVGVLLLLLGLGWVVRRRRGAAALAFAGAVHVKLLPLVALPALARRLGPRALALLAAALAAPVAFYAAWGPAIGAGLVAYAARWERNAFLFAGIRRGLEWLEPTPLLKRGVEALQQRLGGDPATWDVVYRHVWPQDLARGLAAALLLGWVLWVVLRGRSDVCRETYLALAGLLLLSPTMHPWYVLWVLPLAALYLSWGWLAFAALLPLSYFGGAGPVPAGWLWLEYAPLYAGLAWAAWSGRRGRSATIRP